MEIAIKLLLDMIFSGIAAVGFAAISNTPRRVLKFCALIAALGHVSRYCMINFLGCHLVLASLVGAIVVGILAIIIAPRLKCPPETFSFPSLLPMIPGIYAYRTVQALAVSLTTTDEAQFEHWFYLFESNGLITLFVVLAMVIGQMLPILLFPKISFTSTKS
ncbi:MAG: threonine/serine exporter [Bacteroides sp.]|nr:threonine/serine exporter [Bacteroidales bacterium]MBD5291844.1 threonine/serine exporter [Bacteroides sp.]MBD5337542.1 threonine/serine exporter [Bacteroides sp.]MBD5339863.1 threonine/serine exporter [Bacteroides sp.]MDE7510549.1 threonine/serine exporter family protein [Muribaculaceae bacterium]